MPNRKEHLRASRGIAPQSTEYQDKVHKFIDSTAHVHPGDRHRYDKQHTLEGSYDKFGPRGIPTTISHGIEDLKADLLKG